MSRSWEVWDKETAQRLSTAWYHPAEFEKYKNHAHWVILRTVALHLEGTSVLDIGCGIGHLFYLVRDKFNYLGVDTSNAMLEQARLCYPGEEKRFVFGDAYDLSQFEECDSIVANGVTQHLPESEAVIKQLWSKAKICILVGTCVGEDSKMERWGKSIQRRETIEELYKIMRALEDVSKIEDIPIDVPYKPLDRVTMILKCTRKKE